jgi:glycosyltransferase involved in cell wall biosynthesis
MKVLHLFSNTKWTGPAEPVVALCRALQVRGIDVTLACGRGRVPPVEPTVADRARDAGVKVVSDFWLRKHASLRRNYLDSRRLRKYVEAQRFDVIHTHMKNDHLVAALAARRSTVFPPVLRSSYEGDGLRPDLRNRILLKRYTDGLVTCSRKARENDLANFHLPEQRVWTAYGAVDTDQFNPERDLPDFRTRFGLSSDHLIVGVVARIQVRRKFGLLLEAVARASRELDNLRVMIIGRGTKMAKVAVEPAKRLHLERCVIFPGYLRGDEYLAALKCLDAKIYLYPGTDGTCRALLQAMAFGNPCIASKRGVLPEIVMDGINGFVVEDDAGALSDAIVKLARNPELRGSLAVNARNTAVAEFSLQKQALCIENIYCRVIETHPGMHS